MYNIKAVKNQELENPSHNDGFSGSIITTYSSLVSFFPYVGDRFLLP
jgi:hypothetical protein